MTCIWRCLNPTTCPRIVSSFSTGSFSLMWVALSVPITTHNSAVSKQPPPSPYTHPPTFPSSPRAPKLAGLDPLSEFHRGFTRSLWKFTAWLGGTGRKIKLLKAGSDHRWNPSKKKKILMWIQETRCLKMGHRVERVFLKMRLVSKARFLSCYFLPLSFVKAGDVVRLSDNVVQWGPKIIGGSHYFP